MKSGLEDRNNSVHRRELSVASHLVSMKSGLEDRNNSPAGVLTVARPVSQ